MSSERLRDLRGRLKNTNNAGPVVSSCSGEAGNPTTDNITSKYFPIVIDTMVENIEKKSQSYNIASEASYFKGSRVPKSQEKIYDFEFFPPKYFKTFL